MSERAGEGRGGKGPPSRAQLRQALSIGVRAGTLDETSWLRPTAHF
jgi:hypothetical protein